MNPKVPEFSVLLVTFLFFSVGLFLLLSKGNEKGSNKLLSIVFFSLGLSVIDVYLVLSGLYSLYPQYAYWTNWTVLLYGPALYLFTKSVLYKDFKKKREHLLHFLPALGMFLFYLIYYHLQPLSRKIEIYNDSLLKQETSDIVLSFSIMVTMIAYIWHAHREYQKYVKGIAHQFSSLEHKDMDWIRHMLFGFMGIVISSILFEGVAWIIGEAHFIRRVSLLSLFVLFIFVMTSIFRGLRYGMSFTGLKEKDAQPLSVVKRELIAEEKQLLDHVKEVMVQENLFISSELSLDQLARAVSIPSRKLSQLLNDGLGMTFFDFVNKHRVNYACELLHNTDDQELTVLEIMYKSGFNSKSSFNTAFKKVTNTTPTAFRKRKNM